MQSLKPDVYAELDAIAQERDISIQELLRAVVLPEWMRTHNHPGELEHSPAVAARG